MTIDARIPLLSNLDTVTAENNQQRNRLATLALAQQQENRLAKSQDLSNQNTQQEIIAKKLENLSAKDKYNLTEEVHAAAQLKALSGDPEAQRQFLGDRIGNYESRVASGQMSAEDADSHIRLSQHALGLLDTPDGQQQLNNGIDQYIQLGKQAGILKSDKNSTTDAKPLSPTALKLQNEGLDNIGLAGGMNADLGALADALDAGKIDLGPIANKTAGARNWAGESDANSRNFSTLQSSLEKMRNDSLRLNKGVQTEGDAIRAWNELFKNMNDSKLVSRRLREIQGINQRAAESHKLSIDTMRENYGQPPIDLGKYYDKKSTLQIEDPNASQQPSASKSGSPDIKSLSDDDLKKMLGM